METVEARTIFSPATGFIRRGGFDLTCNPYLGCTFGCKYCYAMFLPQNRKPRGLWGKWFSAKRNAVELARKEAPKISGKAIYFSSVTDPYQPAERAMLLTRGVLREMQPYQPRVVIQTRGTLVARDIDILSRFRSLRVNITMGSDSERVRELLEPKSPAYEKRWEAARQLTNAGIPLGLCITPVLPLENPERFAERIASFGASVVVTQGFHDAAGAFGADTSPAALKVVEGLDWGPEKYRKFVESLRKQIRVYEGEKGFFPPPPPAGSSPGLFPEGTGID